MQTPCEFGLIMGVVVRNVFFQNNSFLFSKKNMNSQNDIGDVPEPGHVVRWIRLEKLV